MVGEHEFASYRGFVKPGTTSTGMTLTRETAGSYIDPKTGLGYSMTSTEAAKRGYIATPGTGGGTYDTRTGTYTDTSGLKYSLAQKYVPTGTKFITTTALPERTISGQLEGKQAQVGLPDDFQERTAVRISGKEAVRGFFSSIGYNISQFIKGKREWKDPLKSIELAAKPKREQVAYYQPVFGTTIKDQLISKPITYRELQKDIELKRSLAIGEVRHEVEIKLGEYYTGLQEKIDIGEVPYETAIQMGRIKTEELTGEFQTKAEKIYIGQLDIKGIEQRTSGLISGARITKDIAIYSTPITSAIALGIESKEAPLIIKGDVSEDIALPRYLDYKTTLGMYAAGGIVAGYGAGMLARAGRAVTLGRVSTALEQRPTIITGQRIITKEGIMDITKFKARGDYSIAYGETISISKLTEGGRVITEGISDVQVLTKTYFAEKPLVVGSREFFKVESKILPKTSGVYPSISKLETIPSYEYSLIGKPSGFMEAAKLKGKLYTSIEPPKPIFIGGVSRKEGEFIFGKSGRIMGVKQEVEGKGIKFLEQAEFYFPEEQISILKEVRPSLKLEKFGVGKDMGKVDKKIKPFTEKRPFFETRPQTQISSQQLSQITQPIISPKQISTSLISKQRGRLISPILASQSILLSELRRTKFTPQGLYSSEFVKSGLGLREGFVLSQMGFIKPKLKELQSLREAVLTEGGLIQPRPRPTMKPGLKPGFFIVIPPFRGINLAGMGGGRGQRGIQPQKYMPDLRSALSEITAKKIPKSYYAGAGGIISRPIVIKRGKR